MKLIPSKRQWKRWTLPSKLGVIAAYIGILLAPLSIWSFFTPHTIIHNFIYNSEKLEGVSEKDSVSFKVDEIINNSYEVNISGLKNPEIVHNLKRRLKNLPKTQNINIRFESTSEISIYGDKINEIFMSSKGFLLLNVNGCSLVVQECDIPRFGPSPEVQIKNEISIHINNFIADNIDLVSSKIMICLG